MLLNLELIHIALFLFPLPTRTIDDLSLSMRRLLPFKSAISCTLNPVLRPSSTINHSLSRVNFLSCNPTLLPLLQKLISFLTSALPKYLLSSISQDCLVFFCFLPIGSLFISLVNFLMKGMECKINRSI